MIISEAALGCNFMKLQCQNAWCVFASYGTSYWAHTALCELCSESCFSCFILSWIIQHQFSEHSPCHHASVAAPRPCLQIPTSSPYNPCPEGEVLQYNLTSFSIICAVEMVTSLLWPAMLSFVGVQCSVYTVCRNKAFCTSEYKLFITQT